MGEYHQRWPPIDREASPPAEGGSVFMTISVAPDEPDPPQHRWWAAARFVGEVALVLLIVALGWFAIVAFG